MLLVLAALDVLGAQESAPLLPLVEAVRVALANNERVLGSRESIDQARLGATLAESVFGTKITPNVLGSFGQSDVRNQDVRRRGLAAIHDRDGSPDGHRPRRPSATSSGTSTPPIRRCW